MRQCGWELPLDLEEEEVLLSFSVCLTVISPRECVRRWGPLRRTAAAGDQALGSRTAATGAPASAASTPPLCSAPSTPSCSSGRRVTTHTLLMHTHSSQGFSVSHAHTLQPGLLLLTVLLLLIQSFTATQETRETHASQHHYYDTECEVMASRFNEVESHDHEIKKTKWWQ